MSSPHREAGFSSHLPLSKPRAFSPGWEITSPQRFAAGQDAIDEHIFQPLSLLVVEDEDTTGSIADLLTLHGHDTRLARGCEETLRSAAANPPDVIVLHIGLRRLDGWDVVRRLRDRDTVKPAFVVVVTSDGRDEERLQSKLAGVDLHLVKPIDPAFLLKVLGRFRRVIATARQADSVH